MSHSSIRPCLTSFETKCTVVASALETRLLRHEPGFESACLASTEFMRRADVALLDVQTGPCSGTLVQGPNARIFIVTARHCAAPMWENPEMMPGEWAVLTRYQVPCNASTAQPWSFRDYLQVCDTSGVRGAHCAANLPAWARYS